MVEHMSLMEQGSQSSRNYNNFYTFKRDEALENSEQRQDMVEAVDVAGD